MSDIDELIIEYEKKTGNIWGSSDAIRWIRSAYKVLKECKEKRQMRWNP